MENGTTTKLKKLSAGGLGMLVGFLAHFAYQDLLAVEVRLNDHVGTAGHPTIVAKFEGLAPRLGRIENRLDEIHREILDLISRLPPRN